MKYRLLTPLCLARLDSAVHPARSEQCSESCLSAVCSPVLLTVILSFSSWQTWMCCSGLQFPHSSVQKWASLARCTRVAGCLAQRLFRALRGCLSACLGLAFAWPFVLAACNVIFLNRWNREGVTQVCLCTQKLSKSEDDLHFTLPSSVF